MKYFYILLLFFVITLTTTAQQNPQSRVGGTQGKGNFKMPQIGRLYGTIKDAQTKKGVEFTSVALFTNKDSAVAGCLTKANGDFSLENLPTGTFKLVIRFIGFKKKEVPVSISFQNIEQDMGNIAIEPDAVETKTAVIEGQKSVMQMSIDRKVYNVSQDISVRGGTALDVMKNIPSVTVDNDGNAILRNNGTDIYVDGKPTQLKLEQIPADQIDRVEIITNASAKFEASVTGGILNIIMKKNTLPGYNGVLSAGVGTNNRYNGNLMLSLKQSPLSITAMYGYNHSGNRNDGYTNRTMLSAGQPAEYINQDNLTINNNTHQNARLSMEYQLTNRSTLTLSSGMMKGNMGWQDSLHYYYRDGKNNLEKYGNKNSVNDGTMLNSNSRMMFKKTFPQAGRELSSDVSFEYTAGYTDQSFNYNTFNKNNEKMPGNPEIQIQKGGGIGKEISHQTDYTHPFNDTTRIEAGYKMFYKTSANNLDATQYNYNIAAFETDTFLSSHYSINEMINGAYFNYASMFRKLGIGYQAGVRIEQSYYDGKILNKGTAFSYNYPASFDGIHKAIFPSLYLSKKLENGHEFQFNISRKIKRPNFFQQMPYVIYSDKQNIRIGNPKLTPEFVNISEINYNKTFEKGNFLASAYFRFVENPITQYAFPSPYDKSVLVGTFVNAGYSFTYGLDNTFKYDITPKWNLMLSVNPFMMQLTATQMQGGGTYSGYSVNGKIMTIYRFPLGINLQINADYEGKKPTTQGYVLPKYAMDISLAKDFFGIGSINLSVNDVFNSRRMMQYIETDYYIQEAARRRESRFIKLSFSYRFGKMDASFMKRKKNKSPEMQNGGNSGGDDF